MTELPEQHVTEVTPSGIEVLYSTEPRRLYMVRHTELQMGAGKAGDYDWREVPSVTEVLDVLHKPLQWWGMTVGIDGVRALVEKQLVSVHRGIDSLPSLICWDKGEWRVATVDNIAKLLTQELLTVNHVRDKAGDRGSSVHDAFELWAKEGTVPDPRLFPVEEQPYVLGLLKFLEDVDPEPLASEVMVGSVKHGFAGRYDIRFRVRKPRRVVYKITPKRGAHYAELRPGVYLGDLKTSKSVYESHSRQLSAYEVASIEDGYAPTQERGIIHVGVQKKVDDEYEYIPPYYEFVRCTAEADDFLPVLEVWKSDERMKQRKRKR